MQELIDFICSSGFDTPEFIVKIFVLIFICCFISSVLRAVLAAIK